MRVLVDAHLPKRLSEFLSAHDIESKHTLDLPNKFAGLLLGLNYLYPSQSIIPTIISWSIILFCAAFGIYGFSIQNGMLRILRWGWSKDISLSY